MNWEYSCGAVVFTRTNGNVLFVIVQEQAGAYSFPKGHMEGDETEMETARREVFEETGLHPDFLPGFRELFGIHGTLSGKEFLISSGLALSTLPVFEAGKAIQRAARRKKA